MTSPLDDLEAELVRRLTGAEKQVPTSALGRLRRTAGAALRAGRMLRSSPADEGADLDVDMLASLVGQLGELKGIAMKAGQILSYVDIGLGPELKAALSVLQTHAQPMPFARVRAIVEAELGPRARELLAAMDPAPVAAASIGQVHRARLAGGTPVAVKVQYPGIAAAVASDFGVARVAAGLAARIAGNSTPESFAAEARARTLEECDYLHEAGMQRRFAEHLRGHPTLLVPVVHDAFCSQRVLTTTFVDGLGFERWLASEPGSEARRRAAVALFEFYLGSLFRLGLFNGDPHPGNYLFPADGRVAVLDHGCVRELTRDTVRSLAALTRALQDGDEPALRAACAALGIGTRGDSESSTHAVLRAFYGPMLVDREQPMAPTVLRGMREVLASKRKLLRVVLPGELLFLLRIRFGLMSVLARTGASANWFRLEREYAEGAG